jgi:hypothetical protein
MMSQLLMGGLISLANFGIHAVITGLIVVATRHLAAVTDDLHLFARVSALLMVTMVVLMLGHLAEIAVWSVYYEAADMKLAGANAFEMAFENFTALGYGDEVPKGSLRIIGPVTALNGLLLIGWSVAIIFEVMRMAEVQIGRR